MLGDHRQLCSATRRTDHSGNVPSADAVLLAAADANASHEAELDQCRHTRTGMGSAAGDATCRSCWGMITIRKGSTPRRHWPRAAASSAVIVTVGSSWRNSFPVASGPSMVQYILHLPPINSLVNDHHHCRVITPGHASTTHVAPSIPVPRRPIAHIAQPAP